MIITREPQSEGFLSHEVVEFIFGDEAVQIEIGSFDHLLESVVILKFTEILGDFSQVLEGDVASSSGVKSDENFVDFFSGLVFGRPSGHHAKELIELKLSAAILIDFGDHVPHSLSFGFDTKGVDGFFEFYINKCVPLGSIDPPPS